MLTQSEANQCAQEAAREFLAMPFAELEEIFRRQKRNPDALTRRVQWQGQPVVVDIVLAKYGRWRQRIAIEVVVGGIEQDAGKFVGCAYYERFRSGKTYKGSDRTSRIVSALIFIVAAVVVAQVAYALLKRLW